MATRGKSIAITLLILMITPGAFGSWASKGSREHDSMDDLLSGLASPNNPDVNPNPNYRKLFFNAFPVQGLPNGAANPNVALIGTNFPFVINSFHALLGVWKDCNADGYMGSIESASYVYPSQLLTNDDICPPRTDAYAHNNGTSVRELIPVGPWCDLEERATGDQVCAGNPLVYRDDAVKVWGDYGRPGQVVPPSCPNVFLPRGTLSTAGGTIRYGDCVLRLVAAWETLRNDALTYGARSPCLEPGSDYHVALVDRDLCTFDAYGGSGDSVVVACGDAQRIPGPGGTMWTIPGPDFEALWQPTVYPEGTLGGTSHEVFGNCAGRSTQDYDLYRRLEAERPNDGKKRYADWEFMFYEGGSGDPVSTIYGGLRSASDPAWAITGVENFPVWIATRADTVWSNPFINPRNFQPQAPREFTFYVSVGTPTKAFAYDISPAQEGTYLGNCPAISAMVECSASQWYPYQNSTPMPHQAVVGQPYQLRDVDCFDENLWTEGWTLPPLLSEVCVRPDPFLVAFAEGVDGNRDCLGDSWQTTYGRAGTLGGKADDPDDDGASNLMEFQWRTIPVGSEYDPTLADALIDRANPPAVPLAEDYDLDGWPDGDEISFWDSPNDSCALTQFAGVALYDVDSFNDTDSDGLVDQHDPDADNDTLIDGYEVKIAGSLPHHVDSDCSPAQQADNAMCRHAKYAPTRHTARDITGDNISDGDEYYAWREIGWLLGPDMVGPDPVFWDIDGDMGPYRRSNLIDPDSDGDELLDGDEWRRWNSSAFSDPFNVTAMHSFDHDEDGLLDGSSLTIWPADPRWTRFYHPVNNPIVSCGWLDGSRTFLGERTLGTYPGRKDTSLPPYDCDDHRARSLNDSLAFALWSDRDVPEEALSDWHKNILNGAVGNGTELVANATYAVNQCVSNVNASQDPSVGYDKPCVGAIANFIDQTLTQALEGTPLAPVAQEPLLILGETASMTDSVIGCTQPGSLPAVPNVTAVVDCSADVIIPYAEWLANRTTWNAARRVEGALLGPAAPVVGRGQQLLNQVSNNLTSPKNLVLTIQTAVSEAFAPSGIVGAPVRTAQGASPQSIVDAVINLPDSSDPSESFEASIFKAAGLSSYYSNYSSWPTDLPSVDSMLYGVWASVDGKPPVTKRTLLNEPTLLDMTGDGIADIRVTYARTLPPGPTPSGAPTYYSANMTVEIITSSLATANLSVVSYHRPAGVPFVLTLAEQTSGLARGTVTSAYLHQFDPKPFAGRQLQLVTHTNTTGIRADYAGGAFQLQGDAVMADHDVRVFIETFGGRTTDVKFNRPASVPVATTLSIKPGDAQSLKVGVRDREDVSSPSTEIHARLFAVVEKPVGDLVLNMTDGPSVKDWMWNGRAGNVSLDLIDVVGSNRRLLRIDASEIRGAGSNTDQTTQRAHAYQDASWVSFLHASNTSQCRKYSAVEYVVSNWSTSYCSTGFIRGIDSASLSTTAGLTTGSARVAMQGRSTLPVILSAAIHDENDWEASLSAGSGTSNASFVASVETTRQTSSWNADAPTENTSVAARFNNRNLALSAASAPTQASVTVQRDGILVDASNNLDTATFSASAIGEGIPQWGSIDEAYVADSGAALTARIALGHFKHFLAQRSETGLRVEGNGAGGERAVVVFGKDGAIQTAGRLKVGGGSFSIFLNDSTDAMELSFPSDEARLHELEISTTLQHHRVAAKIRADPVGVGAVKVHLNPVGQFADVTADQLMDASMAFASTSANLPSLGKMEHLRLHATEKSASLNLTAVTRYHVETSQTGLSIESNAGQAAGTVQLVSTAASSQLNYTKRPSHDTLSFAPPTYSLTAGAEAHGIEFTRSTSSGTTRLTVPTARTFNFRVSEGEGRYEVKLDQSAPSFSAEQNAASVWRLSGSELPPMTAQVDANLGSITIDSAGARVPAINWEHAAGTKPLPTAGSWRDIVYADWDSDPNAFAMHLTNVTDARFQARASALAPNVILGSTASAPTGIYLNHGSGQLRQSVNLTLASRPSTWKFSNSLAANAISLENEMATPTSGAGELSVRSADAWFRLHASQGLGNLSVKVQSTSNLTILSSENRTFDIAWGRPGTYAPRPVAEGLIFDVGAGAGAGTVSAIKTLHVEPRKAYLEAFGHHAGAIGLQLVEGSTRSEMHAEGFALLDGRWVSDTRGTLFTTGAKAATLSYSSASESRHVGAANISAGEVAVSLAPTELLIDAPPGTTNLRAARGATELKNFKDGDGISFDFVTGEGAIALRGATHVSGIRDVAAMKYFVSVQSSDASPSRLNVSLADGATSLSAFAGELSSHAWFQLQPPRALGPLWRINATGVSGPFAFSSSEGPSFVQVNASATADPAFAVDFRGKVVWHGGSTGLHDVAGAASHAGDQLAFNVSGLAGSSTFEPNETLSAGRLDADADRLNWSIARQAPLIGTSGGSNLIAADGRAGQAFTANLTQLTFVAWDQKAGSARASSDAAIDKAFLVSLAKGADNFRFQTPHVLTTGIEVSGNADATTNTWKLYSSALPQTTTLAISDGALTVNASRSKPTALGPATATGNATDLVALQNFPGAHIRLTMPSASAALYSAGGNATATKLSPDLSRGKVVEPQAQEVVFRYLSTQAPRYSLPPMANDGLVLASGTSPEVQLRMNDAKALQWGSGPRSFDMTVERSTTSPPQAAYMNYQTAAFRGSASQTSATGTTKLGGSIAPAGPAWSYTASAISTDAAGTTIRMADSDAGAVTASATGIQQSAVWTSTTNELVAQISGANLTGVASKFVTPSAAITSTAQQVTRDYRLEFNPEGCAGANYGNIFRATVGGSATGVAFSFEQEGTKLPADPVYAAFFRATCGEGGLRINGATPALTTSAISTKPCAGQLVEDYTAPTNGVGLLIPVPDWGGMISAAVKTEEQALFRLGLICSLGIKVHYEVTTPTNRAEPITSSRIAFERTPGVGNSPCGSRRLSADGPCLESAMIETSKAPSAFGLVMQASATTSAVRVEDVPLGEGFGDLTVRAHLGVDDTSSPKGQSLEKFTLDADNLPIGKLDVDVITGNGGIRVAPTAGHHNVRFGKGEAGGSLRVVLHDLLRVRADMGVTDEGPTLYNVTLSAGDRTLDGGWIVPCHSGSFTVTHFSTIRAKLSVLVRDRDKPKPGCDPDAEAPAVHVSAEVELGVGTDLLIKGRSPGSAYLAAITGINAGSTALRFELDGRAGLLDLYLPGDGAELDVKFEDLTDGSTVQADMSIPDRLYTAWDFAENEMFHVACDMNTFSTLNIVNGRLAIRGGNGVGVRTSGIVGCGDFMLGFGTPGEAAWNPLAYIPVPYTWGFACASIDGIVIETPNFDIPLPGPELCL